MNKIIISILCLGALTGICFARNISWVKTDEPPIKLSKALMIAEDELIKQGKDNKYYCIETHLGKTFSKADWLLHYSSKDGKDLWINIESDGSVRISKEPFPIY